MHAYKVGVICHIALSYVSKYNNLKNHAFVTYHEVAPQWMIPAAAGAARP